MGHHHRAALGRADIGGQRVRARTRASHLRRRRLGRPSCSPRWADPRAASSWTRLWTWRTRRPTSRLSRPAWLYSLQGCCPAPTDAAAARAPSARHRGSRSKSENRRVRPPKRSRSGRAVRLIRRPPHLGLTTTGRHCLRRRRLIYTPQTSGIRASLAASRTPHVRTSAG